MSELDEVDKIIGFLNKIGQSTRNVHGQDMKVSEIAKLRSKEDEFSEGFDAKLILVDTCLAWRNHYSKKVIPRIKRVKQRFSHVKTLEDLRDLMVEMGEGFNRAFWDFDSQRRKQMLFELTNGFIEYKKKTHIDDDMEAMKDWAVKARIEKYSKGINGSPITCLGIANYQYLRMLCGVNTVKPDTYILKGIETALGYSKKPPEVVKLLEKAAAKMEIPMLEIDQILWVYYANEIPEIGWKP